MIIVKLIGGLGNQMFQYSLGKKLSLINQVPLKVDLSWFSGSEKSDPNRHYELDLFAADIQIASQSEIDYYKYKNGFSAKICKRIDKLQPYYKRRYISEQKISFDENILKAGKNSLFDGFWQSESYFADIRNSLCHDFRFKQQPSLINANLIEQIASTNSVSIHIRRGDYVTNPKASSFHGVLPLEYYLNAQKIISNKVKIPHFFVFSDDPEWAKSNLKLNLPSLFIDHNSNKSYEDLRLMTHCKHHIIANSSFSWWGAWLSQNTDKTVIAPTQWFKDTEIINNDIVPQTWMKI